MCICTMTCAWRWWAKRCRVRRLWRGLVCGGPTTQHLPKAPSTCAACGRWTGARYLAACGRWTSLWPTLPTSSERGGAGRERLLRPGNKAEHHTTPHRPPSPAPLPPHRRSGEARAAGSCRRRLKQRMVRLPPSSSTTPRAYAQLGPGVASPSSSASPCRDAVTGTMMMCGAVQLLQGRTWAMQVGNA